MEEGNTRAEKSEGSLFPLDWTCQSERVYIGDNLGLALTLYLSPAVLQEKDWG